MAGFLLFIDNSTSDKIDKLTRQINIKREDPVTDEDIINIVLHGFFKSKVNQVQYINNALDRELEDRIRRYKALAQIEAMT